MAGMPHLLGTRTVFFERVVCACMVLGCLCSIKVFCAGKVCDKVRLSSRNQVGGWPSP